MDELLTILEAARRLSISPDTLRQWTRDGRINATRTAGGHRRYRLNDVQKLAGVLSKEASASPEAHESCAPSQGLCGEGVAGQPSRRLQRQSYWQSRVEDSRARLQLLRLNREAREQIGASEAQRRKASEERRAAEREDHQQVRLTDLKEYGRSLAVHVLAPDARAQLAEELALYVVSARFPLELPLAEAREFVSAHVSGFIRRCREAQAEAAAQRQRERTAESQKAHVDWLVGSGLATASTSMLFWNASARSEALAEVEARLRRLVRPDWRPDEAAGLARDVVAEFEEEEAEELDGEEDDSEEVDDSEESDEFGDDD